MHRGYVKLWRKSLESGLLADADVWQLMCWCLLKASHKPYKVMINKQMVELNSGQLLFGRVKTALELKSTEKRVRNAIFALEKCGFLERKRASKFSIISIVNWDAYQSEYDCEGQQGGQQEGQQEGQQRASKGPAKGHKQELREHKEYKSVPNGTLVNTPGGHVDLTGEQIALIEPAKNEMPACEYAEIVKLYEINLPTLPRVKVHNDARKRAVSCRWRETWKYLQTKKQPNDKAGMLDFFNRMFSYAAKSDFLMGHNGNNWSANFDFFFQAKSFAKLIEGDYHKTRSIQSATYGE